MEDNEDIQGDNEFTNFCSIFWLIKAFYFNDTY